MRRRVCFNAATKALFVRHEFEHPTSPGRPVHASAMATLLGVTGNYPASGLPVRFVQGVRVWVDVLRPHVPGDRKRSAHRVKCACPGCGRVLSAGRLFQHECEAAVTDADREATRA